MCIACLPDATEECGKDSYRITLKLEFEYHLVLLATGIQINKMTDLLMHLMSLSNKERIQCDWYESRYL